MRTCSFAKCTDVIVAVGSVRADKQDFVLRVFRRPEAVKVEAGGWKEFFGVFGVFALVKRIEKVKFVEKFDVVEVFF